MRRLLSVVLALALVLVAPAALATAKYASEDTRAAIAASDDSQVAAGPTGSDVALQMRADSLPSEYGSTASSPALTTTDDGLPGFVYMLIAVAAVILGATAGFYGKRVYQHNHAAPTG